MKSKAEMHTGNFTLFEIEIFKHSLIDRDKAQVITCDDLSNWTLKQRGIKRASDFLINCVSLP
jgi:hypothetical protein